MNGDFLALLPKLALPGMAARAENRPEPVQATTVFAFHCADGVIFAGDHRATSGHVVFSDQTEKILELDSHSLLAIAGVPAMAFEMARTLQTSFEYYRRSQLQSMSLASKVRALSKLLRENMPAVLQGVGVVMPIFAGVDADQPKAKPIIYFCDPLGAQFEAANFAASGSGSNTIKSVLHYLDKWGHPRPETMNAREATLLANRLLMTAAEFDTATGGVHPERKLFATIKLLSREGIRSMGTEEQQECWDQATA
jgi:proteasome beta subunit